MKHTIIALLLAAIGWCLAWPGCAVEQKPQFNGRSGINPLPKGAPVILVDEGVEPSPILIRPDAAAQEKQAADELAKYLSQISGAMFQVAAAGPTLPERAVLVGAFDMSLPPNLTREGFIIRTEGQRLHLRGGEARATLYAVFGFLEEQLGCRWWAWDAEDVPQSRSIRVVAQDTHLEPAFQMHDLYNREGQNTVNSFVFKRRGKSSMQFTGGHTICPLLQPYAEKNPEFLPMDKNGKRAFNNLHMNYTAAGMSEALAEALEKREIEPRQGNVKDFIYFAGMGDWYGGMDMSPESQRVYEEETWTDPDGNKKPGYIATLLRMMNRSAEILEVKYPGIMVGTFAYMSLEAPPAVTKPRHNLAIWLPRLRHDTVRSIVESDKNRSYRLNLERWAELCPDRLYIWEYGANFTNFLMPFPCLRSLAENIRHYHRIGVSGIMIQGNYVSFGSDMAALKNYVWGKLMWDPSHEVDALVREFCEGYYGPAAEPIIAYVNLLEDSVRGLTPISADEFDTSFKWLTPERVKQAQDLFSQALALTGGNDQDKHYMRVKEAQVSLEAHLLWKDGPLKEVGEQLIREDFGVDTLPRARDLVKYARGASPREWGTGRAYRMGFLTQHGGPMPILKQGPVTVKVAPMQYGQIRSVMLQDVTAIDESRDLLSPHAYYYEMTKRQGNRVEMEAELGVAHWGENTKQISYRAVELTADGVVKTSAAFKAVTEAANTPSVQTTYQVAGKPDQIIVEYQDAAGAWQKVQVNAEQTKAPLLLAKRLRVTRLDRKVVIDDRYQGPNDPSGEVVFDPKTGQVRTVVSLGAIAKLAGDQPTPGFERELRVEALQP